jgi:predicted dehydrogenase
MKRIGVGVIGCGDIARVRYFPSIAALPDLALAGVYSRTLPACEPITRRYGGTMHADLDSFLRDPQIDAVIVATPHPSHAELAIKALAAGKHVLVEKPMATSLADAARIRQAAERSGRVLMALPFDESPPMQAAKRLMQSGAIGRVSSADAVLAHHGPVHAPWFFDRREAGWGVLADLGIYLISQLTYLFGPAESVCGRVATVFPQRTGPDGKTFPATVEDNVAATLVWPDNILASIRANWCSAADRRNFVWQVTLYGTEGVIFINMASSTDSLVVYAPEGPIAGAERIVHNGMSECYRPALPGWDLHQDILRAFAAAIGRGASAAEGSNLTRQHQMIEIIAKLYESSKSGRIQLLEVR